MAFQMRMLTCCSSNLRMATLQLRFLTWLGHEFNHFLMLGASDTTMTLTVASQADGIVAGRQCLAVSFLGIM